MSLMLIHIIRKKQRILLWDVKNLSFLFCCVLLGINLSTAGLLKCYEIGNFTTDSTFGKNLDLILSSLPGNVPRNGGFYRTTIGQGSNIVYALALCRGDTWSDACSSCVNLRVRKIKASCPNQTEAILWEGEVACLVQFDGWLDGKSFQWHRTPDIPQKDSKLCLIQTVDQYQRCCLGQQGDNGGLESQAVVIIVVPIITLVAILALACILIQKRKNRKQKNCKLYDGQDIAVKRLSDNSVHGDLECKNEILLMAKLQHRKLDPVRRLQLDWDKRHKIITGIARGVLYLHQDSRYRIVHGDLKAANRRLKAGKVALLKT
ncbi:Uncharacterized protein TCM_017107 [Theobroma cacao]|uniref:non-specific serine/threonine protein kinase n=1 Tax=Theobroma cacao TaxID=3641 RepID=A0A061ECM5_THECC|nr:Uncharacterized protein TCM_017107 [Theobroma cacao]